MNRQIIRGKRTRRRCRTSGVSTSTVAPSCNKDDGECRGGGDKDGLIMLPPLSQSKAVAKAEAGGEESSPGREQEEDMANCLILLAQGNSNGPTPKRIKDECEGGGGTGDGETRAHAKSKTSEAWVCTYKCKTCDRTFTSFQALGGHRSSHMKPKAMSTQQCCNKTSPENYDCKEGKVFSHSSTNKPSVVGATVGAADTNKARVCLVCGLKFKSGQALGGHMRRHRAVTAGTHPYHHHQLSVTSLEITLHSDNKKHRVAEVFPLDLNLPPPKHDADNSLDSEIHQLTATTGQPPPVISTTCATLVECHF